MTLKTMAVLRQIRGPEMKTAHAQTILARRNIEVVLEHHSVTGQGTRYVCEPSFNSLSFYHLLLKRISGTALMVSASRQGLIQIASIVLLKAKTIIVPLKELIHQKYTVHHR